MLTLRTRIRPISLPTRHPKRPFSGKFLPCRSPKRPYRQSDCQHGRASNRIPPLDLVQTISGPGPARFWTRCLAFPKLKPLRWTWSSHFLDELPGRFGCFRNLNRTLGPTRPILSFTPFPSHGVNDTTPSQKPFWRGMPSFNFRTAVRLCPEAPADAPRTLSATAPATGQTRLLAVLTLRTRIRPISLPTRQQKRPFCGKTLPCRSPNRPYRQSDCQHGKKNSRCSVKDSPGESYLSLY